MGDSTRTTLPGMPGNLMEAHLGHSAVAEAMSHIESVEVLKTYFVARDVPIAISKIPTSEGLTSVF